MKIDGSIIISRWAMMGEKKVPKSEFRNLNGKHIIIFLTEPDMRRWPPEMDHLKKYMEPEDECNMFIHINPLLSAQTCCHQLG